MITYINENINGNDYNVLFKKASAKLGLLPIEKEVGVDADGKPIIEYQKYVELQGGKRELRPCVLYNEEEGADNTNADFDADGNFLIKKFVRHDDELDEDIYEKVISNGITSLNEYFQHIEELSELAIGDGRSGSDPYFLRLPIDEPFFEINANTRGITVPGELSQVGVVGDKLAEILFFKIDRYYDAVDLDTRHIYIEWELPDGTRGISRDFLRDTQSEKDKIIFGWLIDDVLTAQIGTIRFAVRFVEWTDREDEASASAKLLYSFSSLPATISVSNTLHYTLLEDDEELQYNTDMYETAISNMKAAFENATPDSADETAPQPALAPEFVINLGADIEATEVSEGLYTRNLIGGAKGQEHGSLRLEVEAYSPDGGSISYMYGYKTQNTSDVGTQAMPTKHDFKAVNDHSDTHRIYYIKENNDVYTPVSQTDIGNLPAGTQLYERIAWAIAENPGYYKANARNRVSGRKTTAADSYILYIPYAAMPVITTPIEETFVLGKEVYEAVKDEDIDQSKAINEGKSNIKIVHTKVGADTVTLAPEVKVEDIGITVETQTDNLSYQWYKSDNIYDTEMAESAPIEGAVEPSLLVNAPGCYALKINNHFNNDDTETELLDAGVCRVTAMPEIPNLTETWANFEEILIAGRENQPALMIPEVDHDNMHFEWHKITTDSSDLDPIAEGDLAVAEGDLVFTNHEARVPFIPTTAGDYYLLLTNTLNGATAIMNSATSYGVIKVRAA